MKLPTVMMKEISAEALERREAPTSRLAERPAPGGPREPDDHELGQATRDLVKPSKAKATIARMIIGLLVALILLLVVTPWQQSAVGDGRVVAYAPDERKQNLEAPIEGRILKWHVREGATLKKGDPVVDLSDNDPEIMNRLRAERTALEDRLSAARTRVVSIESRIDALTDSRVNAVSAAESRIHMATQRVLSAQQALALAEATLETARINLERQKALEGGGLASKRQRELAELDETRARTEVERAKVALQAARSEERAISADRGKVGNDAFASINDAKAAKASAESEIASVNAEIARLDVRLARQSTMQIVAPRDGIMFRIVANGHSGEFVKAGDVLAVLVPETEDRAVELWIDGNDMPLVRENAVVRVAFEGWPAVQFSGWPSAAIGTFEGRVVFMDTTDSGGGKFRVLVLPAPGVTWPKGQYLRQGVRVHGWAQLGRVRLGWELWRQFNGFPPSLDKEPDGKGGKDGKGDKDSGKGGK
jgi:multidrug efflux pump subunit AcrA (membrane-fusion protein)